MTGLGNAPMANWVDYGVIGLLLLASLWAVAVAFERWLFYRHIDFNRYPSSLALETELTRHLTVIGTVAANAPYIGLLGTVMGIVLTFHKMGTDKGMDVHTIMIGLFRWTLPKLAKPKNPITRIR